MVSTIRPCDAAASRRTLLLGGTHWRAARGALQSPFAGSCGVRGSASGGSGARSMRDCAPALCRAARDIVR